MGLTISNYNVRGLAEFSAKPVPEETWRIIKHYVNISETRMGGMLSTWFPSSEEASLSHATVLPMREKSGEDNPSRVKGMVLKSAPCTTFSCLDVAAA